MYLKSLILKGFKSFADRSVLGFEPGITAVVGPNGSGKSNISDAVLWVLGERNAKNLRGQAMEDVIFAGSSARKPVGIAEVELVLDNSDATLPIDFNEVSIARRMYRSGESEYLINGAIARRMDVLDILHDTGLGTGTHSIISQGSLDSILQSKPEDRRALIEEAAGTLKHKQRKAKSERKLAQMDTHLTRVKDVANEVERQLKPLERKAKRAQAYQGLADELAALNLALAVDDLRNLQTKWKAASENENTLSEQLQTMRLQIDEAEEKTQKLQEEIQERSVSAGDIARRYRRAQSVIERLDSTALLLYEKKRSSQAYEVDLKIALESHVVKREQAKAATKNAEEQLVQTGIEKTQAEEVVAKLTSEHSALSAARIELEKTVDECARQEQTFTRDLEKSRLEQSENQELLSNSLAHEKLMSSHVVELEHQIKQAEEDFDKSKKITFTQKTELEVLKEKEQLAREEVSKIFASREQLRTSLDALRDEIAIQIAEIKGLEEMERASEATSPALSWLMGNKTRFDADITFLSHEIKAPEGLERFVEWLLGADLRSLLVQDIATANQIAETLCELNEEGEISLIPYQRNKIAQPKNAPANTEFLIDTIECDPRYKDALAAIIGDVCMCESRKDAISAHAADDGTFRFATKDGFLIWQNSKISIGMAQESEEGILGRHRRLQDLRFQQTKNQAELEKTNEAKKKADDSLQKAQSESLKFAQELAQMQGSYTAAQEEQKRAEEKLASVKSELNDLEQQRKEAKVILETAQPASLALGKRIDELQESLQEVKEKAGIARKNLEPLRTQTKEVDEALAEARLQVAKLSERENYARRMLESNEQEIINLKKEFDTSRDTLARKVIARGRIEPLLAVFEELSASVKRWAADLEDATNQAQSSSSGLHDAITQARAAARKAHDIFDTTNEKLSEAKVEKGRLEIQVEAAINVIIHDCKTPLESALEAQVLENRDETEDAAFKLRRRIANMGTINPDAAVEFEELKTRYDYMAAQLEDMMSARRALEKIVRVIDSRMKDDFVTTFEQVNENFKEIFNVLFPGGSAELSLIDPQDPENSGIEVSAQPRGKRITKMMLMSGGEKSLTALSLLFAVYRIRSTPFYILDEVEAALDDTNLRRLCAYLSSLRESTQLILITHQRRTMEMSDVLYGISMQADGVTRVVSQKLDRALQYAEG